MKKFFFAAIAAIGTLSSEATCYFSCTASGQGYVVTTNSNGDPDSWAVAGGCALGPWVSELDDCNVYGMPIVPGTDDGMTGKLAADWNPATMQGNVPAEIVADFKNKRAAGQITKIRLDGRRLSSAQNLFLRSH